MLRRHCIRIHTHNRTGAAILCVLLKSVRQDSKVLANYFLGRIPEVHDYCIFVDPFGGKSAPRRNFGPIKEATRLVKSGGMLGVFPSGEVSHMSLRGHGIVDPAWSTSIGRLIRITNAPVVPVFIDGRNGLFFQMAGMIHPRLRTAMLPHELLNKRNRRIRIIVGNPIPPEKLSAYSSDSDLMDYLRFRTYVLANRDKKPISPRIALITSWAYCWALPLER